ncbi:hypothetical protein LguiA_019890 [Lonicera macranthoides]
MESHRSLPTNVVGFSLLPSELIQYIVLRLALPDIIRVRALNKLIASIVSDDGFVRDYARHSSSASWLFIYKKRWHRDATLHGFVDSDDRWFKVSVADILKTIVPPGEDLYFLTASGNQFMFALNTSQEIISVNPVTKTIRKIPPSPLGPRGTSSWRRSGMKLLSGSGHFRFLFAEMQENNPVVFEYNSETDKWRSRKAREDVPHAHAHGNMKGGEYISLSALNGSTESVITVIGIRCDTVIVVRPIFNRGGNEQGQSAIGFSRGNAIVQLHVYGDGNMMIVRSDCADKRSRVLKAVELWGLSTDGRGWEFISRVSRGVIDQIKRPYGVMMGCLEERQGKVRAVLMSNFEGVWDMIWLCFDIERKEWSWVPLPDCKMKGSNMAGITFSSGLTLS